MEIITQQELDKLWLDMGFTQDYLINKDVFRKIINNYNTLNKGIDELLKKYEEYIDNIIVTMSQTNTMVGEYIEKYDKEISKVWQKHECYKEIIQDLKKLKG